MRGLLIVLVVNRCQLYIRYVKEALFLDTLWPTLLPSRIFKRWPHCSTVSLLDSYGKGFHSNLQVIFRIRCHQFHYFNGAWPYHIYLSVDSCCPLSPVHRDWTVSMSFMKYWVIIFCKRSKFARKTRESKVDLAKFVKWIDTLIGTDYSPITLWIFPSTSTTRLDWST